MCSTNPFLSFTVSCDSCQCSIPNKPAMLCFLTMVYIMVLRECEAELTLAHGCIQSVDWTTGLDYWTALSPCTCEIIKVQLRTLVICLPLEKCISSCIPLNDTCTKNGN